jgi:hypothetical protein
MLHPLAELLSDKRSLRWDEVDVRYYIEEWLRQRLYSDFVYCDTVSDGAVAIRVQGALQHQEALLFEYDLKQALKKECGYSLKGLIVRRG